MKAALARRLPPRAVAALRSRRGATAALFAVSGTALIAMAGLATEGSGYYLASRDAQNSADVAAMAAASAYQFRGRPAALGAASEVSVRNGLNAAMVTVRNPPTTGSLVGNSNAFEVLIAKPYHFNLARPFVTNGQLQVNARAVSVLQATTPACILSLTGPLTIQNSSSFQAPGCAIGSNAAGASVSIPQSNSTVVARAVMSLGTCSGCSNTRWSFTEGYQEHAPPLTNPYASLDTKPYTTATGASCLNTAQLNVNGPIAPTGTNKAYCGPVNVSNTSAVTFTPGTYVFQNASLTVGSITSFTCNGCTFIFRGTSPGNLSISNMSTANLTAPSSNSSDADYNGILFHRTTGGTMGTSGAPNLNLQSVSTFNLAGGIYFPGSYVRIGNVSSSSTANCLALVAGTVDIGNLSSFRFDVSGCHNYGTNIPAARIARLVE
ncbi:pilus assembly protein TadG-related protein [Humitalea rosea]|uniref:pilus assembly protein TadG-related protein n=1 Tax=Humitalea rosea TaxID=990373 RepID=UPI001313F63A|nr:pilus assembly protein TadG-related protein [Humitalea rosea]